MVRSVIVVGSTGSIGCNTLSVLKEHKHKFVVKTLVASTSVEKLAEQVIAFNVENAVILDDTLYHELKRKLSHTNSKALAGKNALAEVLKMSYDIAVMAISGVAALEPTVQLIPNVKILGLANKESIVCAGQLILKLANFFDTKIVPIDSEHNAIFQLLPKRHLRYVDKVFITASGGPFYKLSKRKMANVTPEQAVSHPIWPMGAKISVDSATLMNKGLELIEAHYLFQLPISKLDILIHPKSIVHALVSYTDGSTLAQFAMPDMRTPISLALGYNCRLNITYKPLDISVLNKLRFYSPNYSKFPLLNLARNAIIAGQAACIVLNSVNEVAVEAFLKKKITFLEINQVIQKVLDKDWRCNICSIADVIYLAGEAKRRAESYILCKQFG